MDSRKLMGERYRSLVPHLKRVIAGHERRVRGSSLSADELDELVQEAFYRALQAIDRNHYDSRRDLLPYLAAICFHSAADRTRVYRRERAMYSAVLGQQDSLESNVSELDVTVVGLARTSEVVSEWLSQQSASIRALCHRRFWMNESQRVAARELQLSRQQVRTLEQQMRLSLAKYLRALEVDVASAAVRKGSARRRC